MEKAKNAAIILLCLFGIIWLGIDAHHTRLLDGDIIANAQKAVTDAKTNVDKATNALKSVDQDRQLIGAMLGELKGMHNKDVDALLDKFGVKTATPPPTK